MENRELTQLEITVLMHRARLAAELRLARKTNNFLKEVVLKNRTDKSKELN